ncbi:MAG TPA: biotin/lipoate A/B protein ligase family protein [Syntrophorhabdaceae bacterium]|nr:biotin/lipoate A/B protein ligase family protein [Syntrophorhabdaceae bacterium]
MATWRCIDSRMTVAENMAIDKVMLTSRSQGWSPDTLLFLEFTPCALVGYHQSVELEVEEDYCREHGIEVQRRLTGGGAIYMHEGTLGWAIYADKHAPGIPADRGEMYARMCGCVTRGLSRLGVNAKFRPKNDIEVNGRKISGTGGTELDSAFMFTGSLLIDFDVDTMIRCLKLPIKKLEDKQVASFRQRVTSLHEEMGYTPDLKTVKKALLDGFSEGLGVTFAPGALNDKELILLAQEASRLQSQDWIRGGRTMDQDSALKVSDFKSPGGLIRVSVLLDRNRKRIKSAFITGDFFAYPERSILDLEAFLRNSSSDDKDIFENIQTFFKTNNLAIPGVTADHMAQAVCQAISSSAESEQVL